MYFASNVNVTASHEHVEGKYFADGVGQNVEKVMSLAITAMLPQRVNLQIVRIQVSRRSQAPMFLLSSPNCNQFLQVNLMFFHQAIFLYKLRNCVYHSTSCDHSADFRKQAT